MRKSYIANSIRCISFLFLLSSALLHGACGPTVTWDGSANIITDVIDSNIFIDAITFGDEITLEGGIAVHAVTCDISVTMNASAIIQGDPVAGNSRLYLNPAAGRSITLTVTQDLIFQGSAFGAAGELDLLVTVTGAGEVIFVINDGINVVLRRQVTPILPPAIGGGVRMYRQSDPTVLLPAAANLLFTTNQLSSAIASVQIGTGCILSYLIDPSDGSNSAQITFTPGDGDAQPEIALQIADQGAVLIRGNQLGDQMVAYPPKYLISDIFPGIVPGQDGSFIFAVTNVDTGSPAPSALLIQNSNNTFAPQQFLWDPWCISLTRTPGLAPYGTFDGIQYGFVVGSTGELLISEYTFLDYRALSFQTCPITTLICDTLTVSATPLIKQRNASALFTDSFSSSVDPITLSNLPTPIITLQAHAGLYLRANNDAILNPLEFALGAGITVMDIEGQLFVRGANLPGTAPCFADEQQLSKIEVLSWLVDSGGMFDPTEMGPLFTDYTVQDPINNPFIFPRRTFANILLPDPSDLCSPLGIYYLAYNKASILNNGRADLITVSLDHTDEIHTVIENNDIASQPTYIGGETWHLPCLDCAVCIARPMFAFFNSRFNIHTNVALTGVDLLTEVGGPSGDTAGFDFCADNISKFVFYQNGKMLDNGTGRFMILGTFPGSTACDGCTVVSGDAHLNVMQDNECDEPAIDELVLTTTANTALLVPDIPAGDLSHEYAIQTIYLGNNSNISIGAEGNCADTMTQDVRFASYPNTQTTFAFNMDIFPTLLINSNLFAFETRGGSSGLPENSNVTGQGGIFVDANGIFTIGGNRLTPAQVCVPCLFRAYMGVMVTASCNGLIDLPANRVLFAPRVGIAFWGLDMNMPSEQVIVRSEQDISDYTLNWLFVTKDYTSFMPYYLTDCYSACFCPPVTEMNVSAIPTIEGNVRQLQIKGSRLGDPVHVKVNGGSVGELILLSGFNSGEAPVAVVVLENQGLVGLGSAHRTVDSLEASIQLGVNGVNVILNGNEGQVNLNEDVIVNNICAFLPGPDITADGVLRITSECCNTLRVTKDGILDLSGFGPSQAVEFAGNVRVVFEPGAKVIFANQTTLRFADDAICQFDPLVNTNIFSSNTLVSTDTVRVKFVGSGILEFTDCASASLPLNAFVGVETDPTCDIDTTQFTLLLLESSKFQIGDPACRIPGGAFQVGNTTGSVAPGEVSFILEIDGPEASFEIGQQGFFGLGVGIASKLPNVTPNSWLVAPTSGVESVTLQLINGKFVHAQLFATSDIRSSIMAVSGGEVPNGPFSYTISPLFDTTGGTLLSNMSMLGGGNIIACLPTATPFAPIVGVINGLVPGGYEAGILKSTPLLSTFSATNIDGVSLQQFLRVVDIRLQLPANNRGVVAPNDLRNEVRVGYVDTAGAGGDGFIGRADIEKIVGKSAQTTIQEHSVIIGVVGIVLENTGAAPRAIVSINEIGQ